VAEVHASARARRLAKIVCDYFYAHSENRMVAIDQEQAVNPGQEKEGSTVSSINCDRC